jgi:hypothetical protein
MTESYPALYGAVTSASFLLVQDGTMAGCDGAKIFYACKRLTTLIRVKLG